MQVKEIVIPYKYSNPVKRLYFIGDPHFGTIACCEDRVKEAVETIHDDKNGIWVNTGDNGEYITPDDPRYDNGMIADWVSKKDVAKSQEKHIAEIFRPIATKCIGMNWGNHEFEYTKHKFGDVHSWLCEDLKVINLGFACFIDLVFKRENSTSSHRYRCCGTHGSSNSITPAGKLNVLHRWMQGNDAQIYWYAHMHDILHKPRGYLSVGNNKKLINKEALGVVTGSFYRTYMEGIDATYGERKNYPLNKIGYPMIEINVEEDTLSFSEKIYLK
jgi:hypothetical protein